MNDNNISPKNFLYTINNWDTFQKVKSLLGRNIKTSKCIAILGKMYSGKTTCAKYIQYKYGYNRYFFASPLKKIINDVFNLNDDDKKNNKIYKYDNINLIIDKLNKKLKINNLKELSECEKNDIIKLCCDNECSFVYRKMLQYIGTEIFRKRQSNFWVFETIQSLLQEPNNVVIDDVRFLNEHKTLRDLYGNNLYTIKIVRPIKETTISSLQLHPSEEEMGKIKYNEIIFNDKSLLVFYKKIDNVMKHLKEVD